jgi:hypothetical protein
MNETELQTRLRRAKESLAAARAIETTARIALANAVQDTKRAKERYEALFLAEDAAEKNRRNENYRHATK